MMSGSIDAVTDRVSRGPLAASLMPCQVAASVAEAGNSDFNSF